MKFVISMLCCLIMFTGSVYADDASGDFRWKDLRAACKGNHESEECKQIRSQAREFCQANPNKKRCRKLHAKKECRQNPDSEKCLQYKQRIKAHCQEHPESKKCMRIRTHKVCKDKPESEQCLAAKEELHDKFCQQHPHHKKCT